MNAPAEPQRRYRFADLRRSGLFGSMPPTLLVTLGAGILVSWLTVLRGAPLPLALAPLALAAYVGFGRLGGRPVHEQVPPAVAWWWRKVRHRHRWCRPVPLVVDGAVPQALPPSLAGIELFDADTSWITGRTEVGVVHDRATGIVTAVLRVTGDGQFALADAGTQETRLDLWGLALAAFCREATPVARITCREWTSPTGTGDHLAQVRNRWADEAETAARSSYLTLVEAVAPTCVRHDVLIEVSVDQRRARRATRRGIEGSIETLIDEVRLFAARLDQAGLTVAPPLSAAEVVTATRARSDPSALPRLAAMERSLAAAAGHAPSDFGPMAVKERWASVRVDGSVHRSWWFARWPRREVPAGWFDQVLFGVDATRTITVVFEPVAPARSYRDVNKESVSRETNADERARRGFRVRAADRKAARDVQLREGELNDGYSELAYVGLLTVTAVDDHTLDGLSGVVEQTAAQAGIELHPLFGRHAAGWVASLPLGRTVARRTGS
jgi:hypothetical protein